MTDYLDNIRTVSLRGLRQAWRETGPDNAPTLVLMHGLLDNSASFAPTVEALAGKLRTPHRLIAPDWRGHGATDWAPAGQYWFPEYLADLDALLSYWVDDQPVTLIGHSMGGQIASLFAGSRPGRVDRLVTLDSLNVPDSDRSQTARRYRRWLDAQAEVPRTRTYQDIGDVAARIAHRYPELTAAQHVFLAEHWTTPVDNGSRVRMRVDPWHRVSFPYGFRADEAKAVWQRVTAPVMCIDGGASPATRFTDEAEMRERRACFTDLQHIVVNGCGHMLHLQAPDKIATHIAAFV